MDTLEMATEEIKKIEWIAEHGFERAHSPRKETL